jgi:F0F1-type ATP synthase delta subunit
MQPTEYAQLLYEVLEGKSENMQDKILGNFKNVLVRSKETHLASAIEKELAKIQTRKEQERTTYISSAGELTSRQKAALAEMTVEPREFSVSPSLLGGVAVRQKDAVYNATLRKKIETLKWQL